MGSITDDVPELRVETRFNINDKVKVLLTERGLEVLRSRVQETMYAGTSERVDESIRVQFLRDGAYVFQMYEFMAIFGPSLPFSATTAPGYHMFEGNNIVLMPDGV